MDGSHSLAKVEDKEKAGLQLMGSIVIAVSLIVFFVAAWPSPWALSVAAGVWLLFWSCLLGWGAGMTLALIKR
jgi:hypothetical protein